MEKEHRKEMRDYAWQYFALHADQRIKTFNFFLILVAVILGGLLAFVKDAKLPPLGGVPGGLLLIILSWVFWKLDTRNRELIHHAEEALRTIEADIPETESPKQLRLFTEEDEKTDKCRSEAKLTWNPLSWIVGHYNYRDCFRAVFVVTGIMGFIIAIGSFFIPSSKDPSSLVPQQQFFIGTTPVTPAQKN